MFECYLDLNYESDIIIETCVKNAEFEKLMNSAKMIDLWFEKTKSNIRQKVFTESGTSDDMVYLYKEAYKEASAKKDNIIKRIFSWITNFISNIMTKISNLFKSKNGDKKNDNEEVEIEENVPKTIDELLKECDSLNMGVQHLEKSNFDKAMDIIKAIKTPLIIAGGYILFKRFTRKSTKAFSDKISKVTNFIKSASLKVYHMTGDFAKEIVLAKMQSLLSVAGTLVVKLTKSLHGKYSDWKKNRAERKEEKKKEKELAKSMIKNNPKFFKFGKREKEQK